MKTIDNLKDQLMGKSIFADLTDLFRAKDADFCEIERKYFRAVGLLREAVSEEQTPNLDRFLASCTSDVISAVVYAGYLGFRLNLESFHHPVGIHFVQLDTIDYLKGHMFGHFPVNHANRKIQEAFPESLPKDAQCLFDDIMEYYTYLECAGPKMAHYAGYIIGNHLLPWVEPGYQEDPFQTLAYTAETQKFFGMLPL